MMHPSMMSRARQVAEIALALTLAGCGMMPNNRLLDSVHQPVIDHRQYQLDLMTGPNGLATEDLARLDGWFAALGLRYGDRIAIDDPLAVPQTRAEIKSLAARYGLLIGNAAPITPGVVNAGTVRIIVSRASASVPRCPDLATRSETSFSNGTSSNYGCAINGNLAAMVANPDDLLHGAQGQAMPTASTSDKAIWLYQGATPTGQAGVTKNSTN